MKKVNLQAPICYTGYGVAGFNIFYSLSQITDLTLFPIGTQATLFFDEARPIFDECLKKQHTYDFKAPTIKIWHSMQQRESVGKGMFLPFPFFELDTFDVVSTHTLKHCCDRILVSSNWAKDIIRKNEINSPCTVVPLGVDTNIFNHNIIPTNKPDAYVFGMIGKWEIRKGHDILLDIFEKAFPNNENIELWISASSDNGYTGDAEIQQWENMYKNSKLGARVKIYPQLPTHADIANFISHMDCGIYISRAEGWNLELLETMAMNKPVIASNYSAHTEFCNKDNSFLFDIDETEPAFDGKFFKGQGNWAKIGDKQIDQIIDYLRYLYKNNIRTNNEGLNTANKFSWENTCKIINSVL